MSLKGIFSGRDLLSFYCKKLFIAAWLTPRAGRRAGGRKEGRAAAGTAWRGRRLRAPPGAASADHAKGTGVPARRAPKESPPTLTRKRHRSPRPSATRGDGCGGSRRPSALWSRRAGGARVQAVDRRNRPAAAAAGTEEAGTGAGWTRGAPHPGNGCRRSPAPPSAAPPATVPQAFGEGRRRTGVSPLLGPFLVVVVVSGNFIKSVPLFLCLPLPEEPALPPRSG